MRHVGLIRDPLFMEHITSDYHPEHPSRLEAIYGTLDTEVLHDPFVLVKLREATEQEIVRIHDPAYYQLIESTSGCGARQLDPDTHVSSETYRIAKLAAGGLLALVDSVYAGETSNGFALVRPPGHHAERDRGMGFCIYNNIAIAAQYALDRGLARKVLVVDWDLHHGNGTQHSFAMDDKVLYFSTHAFPYYPGTGRAEEVGGDRGAGFTVNVPLPGGQGDDDYAGIFEEILLPVASQYKPDLVLVSAGFDIYCRDPLGNMAVTEEGFARMTQILMSVADAHCNGRLVMTLEGGYNVDGQARSVKAVLETLAQEDPSPQPQPAGNASDQTRKVMSFVKEVQSRFWKFS